LIACTVIRRNPTMDALDGDPATTAGLSCVASHQGPVFTDGIEAGANLARCCTNARDIAARIADRRVRQGRCLLPVASYRRNVPGVRFSLTHPGRLLV